MKYILIVLSITLCQISFGQYEKEQEDIFVLANPEPQFPGGDEALVQFLKDNTVYPPAALEAEIQGKVYIQFVVEKDGSLTDIEVVKGAHELLDKEALRVVKSMPNWIPGELEGEKVRVRFVVPIFFKLT